VKLMELRKSGINLIGDTPWGTHFCQFYETKEDLIDILVPYFRSGLENNEFCMLITSTPLSSKDAKYEFNKLIPNFEDYLKTGQMEILSYNEWYTVDGLFDTDRVLDGWVKKHDKAILNGFDGLRLSGNTFWLEKEDWNNFVEYEEAVDTVIGNFKMMALCTYCLEKCNAAEVIDVVNNHEFALIKRSNKWELIETTEHKRTEKELLEAMNLLRKSNSELEQFAYVASHDLKEPLRMITSFLQLLDKKYQDELDDDAHEYIDFAVDGAKRMNSLIDDLLEYSRLNDGNKNFRYLKTESILNQALDNLDISSDENIIVSFDSLPLINCNDSQIIQLFQNLIGNAIKYNDKNQVKIWISAESSESDWLFKIKDNGIGIDPKNYEKIFQIFNRLHTINEFEGTGIGLAISKKIVDNHDGKLWVESELGKGSSFNFTIPK